MTLFLFALVLGALLIGLVAFGVVDHDHDIDHTDGLLSINLRGIAYGAVVFGGLGIGLTLMKVPGTILWPVSVAGGIGAMLGVTALFGWLRRSESGQTLGDGAWFGVEGTLVVPFDRATRLGRVSAVVGGQVHELTATWNEDEPLPDLPVGAPVLIDRLDRGIAVLTNLT
jgi:hypothetical protein